MSFETENPSNYETPRATRLPVKAPVQYEAPGTGRRHATTVNVSRSGVLIEQDTDQLPGGLVRFRLNFAVADRSAGLPDLLCEGRVVRTEPVPTGVWRIAMTIDNYESVWPKES